MRQAPTHLSLTSLDQRNLMLLKRCTVPEGRERGERQERRIGCRGEEQPQRKGRDVAVERWWGACRVYTRREICIFQREN